MGREKLAGCLNPTQESVSMNVNRQRLLNRFLQYVAIDTTANENTDEYPSSPGQMEIGKLLVEQMLEMGIEDAHQDLQFCLKKTLEKDESIIKHTMIAPLKQPKTCMLKHVQNILYL